MNTLPTRTALLLLALAVGCKGGKDATDDTAGASSVPVVVINEIVSQNATGLQDETGAYPDWIELYNLESRAVDLSGYFLTDDVYTPLKWMFPEGTTIPANGYLVVFADSDPEQGPLHTTFNLDAAGEFIGLYGTGLMGNPELDGLDYPPFAEDFSFGRLPDGEADWGVLWPPTPGEANRLDDQPTGGIP